MPRGVYDRSKSKEERAAEKAAAAGAPAKAPKGKPGRKPGKVAKAVTKTASPKAAPVKTRKSKAGAPKAETTHDRNLDVLFFSELRQNLAVLTGVADKFEGSETVAKEIEAHVQTLGQVRERVFGSTKVEEPVEDAEEVEEAAPAAPSNGAAAAPAAGTVPLPPTPATWPTPPPIPQPQ